MKPKAFITLLAGTVFALAARHAVAEENGRKQPTAASSSADSIPSLIAQWPERPRLGAQQMLAKYGDPQEVTSEKLVWRNPGAFKRITVTKSEDHHDFPLPHMDYLEVTIDYKVPADRSDELMKFDGSVTFDKTRGEMSARCDLEGHDILSLNLAHDVATGKKSAEEARKAFGEIVAEDMAGNYPVYTIALQFEPAKMFKDSDKPSMPGAPKRALPAQSDADKDVKGSAKDTLVSSDAEILSLILAVDTNEIVAAMEAAKKKLSPVIADYAKMLHMEHGKNAAATMKLAQKIEVTPVDTEKTNALRVKGAGELAALIPLADEKFEAAYLAAMTKGHTEVLAMIDNILLKSAEHESLKAHVTKTREHVAMHLEKAKQIQTDMSKAGTAGK